MSTQDAWNEAIDARVATQSTGGSLPPTNRKSNCASSGGRSSSQTNVAAIAARPAIFSTSGSPVTIDLVDARNQVVHPAPHIADDRTIGAGNSFSRVSSRHIRAVASRHTFIHLSRCFGADRSDHPSEPSRCRRTARASRRPIRPQGANPGGRIARFGTCRAASPCHHRVPIDPVAGIMSPHTSPIRKAGARRCGSSRRSAPAAANR